ncbi:RNA polymerase sigma factor [soil metagenome]
MKNKEPEDIILDKILQGDPVACRLIIDKYKIFAFNIALKITGNREDAEEITQDSFLKAFKSLSGFNRTSKFSTWLYRITFNMAVSKTRKKKVFFQDIYYENSSEVKTEVADFPSEELEKTEIKKILEAAMNQLSQDDNLLLTMYYMEEMSMAEVAEITGLEENNVKVKIHRARKKLHQLLKIKLKGELDNLYG